MATTRTILGAELKVIINNNIFADCTGISWTIESGRESVRGLDSNLPFEVAEGGATIRGRMDLVRLRRSGGVEGQGLTALPFNFALEKYISIRVIEKQTSSTVFASDKALVVNQNWQIQARGMMRGSLQFESLDYINESIV